jgi:hypothetical protein
VVPGGLLTAQRFEVSSDCHNTFHRVSGRQAPDVVGSGYRTSASAPTVVRGADGVICVQIHLLILNTLPASFDEQVIPPAALSVNADLHPLVFQEPRELLAGELTPLIRVEDPGTAILRDRFPHRIKTEVCG